jgi:hypothetical protein
MPLPISWNWKNQGFAHCSNVVPALQSPVGSGQAAFTLATAGKKTTLLPSSSHPPPIGPNTATTVGFGVQPGFHPAILPASKPSYHQMKYICPPIQQK